MEEKIKVLYVDDEPNNLYSFKANFRRDFKIFLAESGAEALEVLEKEKEIEIILTDQRMPQMTGIEFLVQAKEKFPDPMRLLITGYADINAVVDAINKGQVFYYLTKPWNEDEVKIAVRNAMEVYSLRKENRDLLEKLQAANEQLEFLLRQKLLS